MNRNTSNRFANMPTAEISRSKFNMPQKILGSGNVGQLIPFYLQDVIPGDSVKIQTSKIVRLQTPITPFMDNIYLDTYYFFVPSRLVWSHWQNFMGESVNAWLPNVEYTEPQIEAPASTGFDVHSIAAYLGIKPNIPGIQASALPIRAYAKIVDDWFISTPLQDHLNIPIGDSTQSGTNGTDYVNDIANGGMPFIANKFHDYFTSALPSPQRGPEVSLNIGTLKSEANVYGNGLNVGLTDGTNFVGAKNVSGALYAVDGAFGKNAGDYYAGSTSVANQIGLGVPTKTQLGDHPENSGLIADINIAGSTLVTINQLRQAFQIQKYYERLARGGDRYIEQIKSMFNVNSPDARLQRSEYLGGNRVPFVVNQVLQSSATDIGENATNTPLGTTGAMSLTADTHFDFDKSFTEHGYIIGLMVARYHHTYQYGMERLWSRKTKFDYYWPVFANLGEQAIKNKEIFAQGPTEINPDTGKAYDDEVFGYQEAWAEYRYKPNRIIGEMRSDYATSLDVWHLGDDYATLPKLSYDWLKEDKANVDRVLQVTSEVSNQYFFDIEVYNTSYRPLPFYSIPGFLDHH